MNIKGKYRSYLVFIAALALHAGVIGYLLYNKHQKEIKEQELVLSFTTSDNKIEMATLENEVSKASQPQEKQNKFESKKIAKSIDKNSENKEILQEEEKIIKKTVNSIDSIASEEKQQIIAKNRSVIFNASYLKNPQPLYPALSRRLREQGLVVIYAYIENDGKVSALSVKSSSGFDRLDKSALQAIQYWHFLPAKKNNILIASLVEIPINFTLE